MNGYDASVAVISIYNILEINYKVILVHFHESRHDLTGRCVLFTRICYGQLMWDS